MPLPGFQLRPRHAGWCAIRYAACTWTKRFPFRCGKGASFSTSAPPPAATRTPSTPGSLRQTDKQNFSKTNFELGPSENRISQTNRVDERTDADGHGRKANSPDKTDWRTSHGAPHRSTRRPESLPHRADSVRHGGRILEARSRPAADFAHSEAHSGSFPADEDGQRPGEGIHRLPRAAQRVARAWQGRYPLPSQRHAGRSESAGRVDDLEDRHRERSVWRSQGRRDLRPQAHVEERTRTHDAALCQ